MRFYLTTSLILAAFLITPSGFADDAAPAYLKPVVAPGMFEHYTYYRGLPDANKRSLKRYKGKAAKSRGVIRKGGALLDYAIMLSKAEQTKYDEAQAKKFDPNRKPNNRGSQTIVQKARKVLQKAVSKTKKGNPEVMYLYAYALALSGQPLAVNMFDEVVTGFKGSPMAAESTLALGEFYFFSQDMERANREYVVAVKSDQPDVRYYAKYKMAWADYLLAKGSGDAKKLSQALLALADLIKILNKVKGSKVKSLAEQVELDVVGLAADLNDPADVKRVLAKVGKPEIYEKTIERMALIKAQSGDLNTAYKLYANLLKGSPKSKDAPKYSQMLIEIGVALGNMKVVYSNLLYAGKTYLPKKSKWRKGKPKELLKTVTKDFSDMIFGYAVEFDKNSFQSKDQTMRDYAYKLYALYIQAVPRGASSSDARYNLAVIQNERQQFDAAAKNLARILRKDKKVKGKSEIAALMVQSAANAIANERQGYKLPPPGQAPKPMKFSKMGRLYNMILDVALKQPGTKENKVIYSFELGLMYYDFGHYDKAKKYWNAMLKQAPESQLAADAATRLFEYSVQQKDKKQFKRTEKLVSSNAKLKANENIIYYLSQGFPDKKKRKKKPAENAENGETAIAEDKPANNANAANTEPVNADATENEESANGEG